MSELVGWAIRPPDGSAGFTANRWLSSRPILNLGLTMPKRSWAYLLALVLICAIAGGWFYYYKSKCHGIDECAAQAAEGKERDAPSEPR